MSESRRLHLLRHAKSAWEDPMQSDHDRPLAARGRRAVKLIHDYVRDRDVSPELVICSTSRRTVETLQAVEPGGELRLEPRIYSAGSLELLDRIRDLDPAVHEVMIIGHNPALQVLVLKLAAVRLHSSDIEAIRVKFPTGALATLAFDGEWSTLAPGGAELVSYVRPKALQYQ